MWMRHSESDMSRVTGSSSSSCSASLTLTLILVIGVSTATSAQSGDNTLQTYRLLSSTQQHRQQQDELIHPSIPTAKLDLGKARKVREISRVGVVGEEDTGPSSPASDYSSQQQRQLSTSKFKALYPPLSGSGELLRLFRPLALSPDKTIGMGRWYLPGFGYFSRGGRAASSNFIRFGRSGKFLEDDDGSNGGDVTMLSRNNAKKKNNFIRLGRENPRQTNFIRLGRSGPPMDLYSGPYATPPIVESFRDDEDGRHEFN